MVGLRTRPVSTRGALYGPSSMVITGGSGEMLSDEMAEAALQDMLNVLRAAGCECIPHPEPLLDPHLWDEQPDRVLFKHSSQCHYARVFMAPFN